jgi:hypothetical protein
MVRTRPVWGTYILCFTEDVSSSIVFISSGGHFGAGLGASLGWSINWGSDLARFYIYLETPISNGQN